MTTHTLKTHPFAFDAIKRGEKNFEVRINDRGFQAGDIVVLQRTREGRPDLVEMSFEDWKPRFFSLLPVEMEVGA